MSSLTSKLYRGGTGAGGAPEPADKTTPGKDTKLGTSVFKVVICTSRFDLADSIAFLPGYDTSPSGYYLFVLVVEEEL